MVYLLDDLEAFDEKEIYAVLKWMPHQRREQFHRYHFWKDQRLCCLAYLLFLYGMLREKRGRFCDIYNVPFAFGEDGKPYLKKMESLHFNISHCNAAVACGISEYPIGVDVQEYETQADESVMQLVFSELEKKEIRESRFPEQRFTRYWTLKESYYKCIGTGLIDEMKEKNFAVGQGDLFQTDRFCFYTKAMPSYQLSVCEEKNFLIAAEVIPVAAQEIKRMVKRFKNESLGSII